MIDLEKSLKNSGLEHSLIELVKTRASQINGCAYCIGMHTDEALRDGETPERLLMLDAWDESSLFDDRERAVLEWVEDVTLIADTHAPKESFDGLKAFFSEEEIGWLTLAATLINAWNRIAISSRGQYDRAQFQQARGQAKVAEPA